MSNRVMHYLKNGTRTIDRAAVVGFRNFLVQAWSKNINIAQRGFMDGDKAHALLRVPMLCKVTCTDFGLHVRLTLNPGKVKNFSAKEFDERVVCVLQGEPGYVTLLGCKQLLQLNRVGEIGDTSTFLKLAMLRFEMHHNPQTTREQLAGVVFSTHYDAKPALMFWPNHSTDQALAEFGKVSPTSSMCFAGSRPALISAAGAIASADVYANIMRQHAQGSDLGRSCLLHHITDKSLDELTHILEDIN